MNYRHYTDIFEAGGALKAGCFRVCTPHRATASAGYRRGVAALKMSLWVEDQKQAF